MKEDTQQSGYKDLSNLKSVATIPYKCKILMPACDPCVPVPRVLTIRIERFQTRMLLYRSYRLCTRSDR